MQGWLPKEASLAAISNMITAPASSILDWWFESDILKGTLASDAVIGANMSPHTPGSAYVLMHHVMGELHEKGIWSYVGGGMGTISDYLAWCAENRGAYICVNAAVDEITTDAHNRINGVRLVNGVELKCDNVVTNCTDPVTFGKLIPESKVPEKYLKGMNNASFEGV